MALFSRKTKARASPPAAPPPPTLTELIPNRNFAGLHINDAELRFWLPELGWKALDENRRAQNTTASHWLREFLVAYLYGEHELTRMQNLSIGLYERDEERVFYDLKAPLSKEIEVHQELGKKLFPVKLFLPKRLKGDLQKLADDAKTELSPFLREILIVRLLGHSPRQTFSEPLPEQRTAAEAWTNGALEPEKHVVPAAAMDTPPAGDEDAIVATYR